jgi:hypothetical protein
MSPPLASFRSNGWRGGRSRAIRSRIATTSSMVLPASRGRDRISSIAAATRRRAASAATTRARLSARCSQVQALLVVIGDEAGEARRQRAGIAGWPQAHVGFVEHALGGRRGHAATRRWVRRAK